MQLQRLLLFTLSTYSIRYTNKILPITGNISNTDISVDTTAARNRSSIPRTRNKTISLADRQSPICFAVAIIINRINSSNSLHTHRDPLNHDRFSPSTSIDFHFPLSRGAHWNRLPLYIVVVQGISTKSIFAKIQILLYYLTFLKT